MAEIPFSFDDGAGHGTLYLMPVSIPCPGRRQACEARHPIAHVLEVLASGRYVVCGECGTTITREDVGKYCATITNVGHDEPDQHDLDRMGSDFQ